MQRMPGEVVCGGCRSILRYERAADTVCCVICRTITPVHLHSQDMAQIVCGGCHRVLMYARGAVSVRCSCCNTINIARSANQLAHVTCGQCHTTLVYPHGAPCVKCALCNYVTNVGANNGMMQVPVSSRSNGSISHTSTSALLPKSNSEVVVIENPMSVNEKGKLVNNVVVGVTTGK
ncbi:hypothetical protein HPP92_010772 [Vanilla planifolia]|uniref:Zinc finger LSD1-type domain-containing protein n=1 Tax=Vanilla planifolia TaxID=51239 RepID=A0A835RAB4_VANPL|nr:hypothetical protein HPP92_010772 [Vanilla planifolia]